MNIGIDIDDTITNTQEMLTAYGHMYEMEYLGGIRNFKKNEYFERYNMFDWTREQYDFFMNKYMDYIGENMGIKVLVKEVFDMIKKDNHKIILITARNREEDKYKDPYKSSEILLKNNNILYDKLIVECYDKLSCCIENNVELFIDDKLDTCKKVSAGGIKVFLMNAMQNEHLDEGDIERVYSWPEIYYKIKVLGI